MTVERWDMSPSSMPDRYVLKVRGERADVDKLVRAFGRVCQEVRELADPVYQWAVIIIGATLSERLSIQDQMREMARPAVAQAPKPTPVSDLTGVLAELSMVLGDLTSLTAEEQAFVAKKQGERQERKSRTIPPMIPAQTQAAPIATPPIAPPPRPPATTMPDIGVGFEPFSPNAVPSAPVSPKPVPEIKLKAPEPTFEIVRDVAPPPSRPADPPVSKAVPTKPVSENPVTPAAAVPPPPQAVAPVSPPSAPASENVSPDQIIRAACFYAPGADALKETFFAKLTEVAQKKSKKPFLIQPVLSQSTQISAKQGADWANKAKTAGAEVVFVLLPPELGPEFLEQAVVQLELAGLHGYLIVPSEIESRLLYVDLTVELMLIKRHK